MENPEPQISKNKKEFPATFRKVNRTQIAPTITREATSFSASLCSRVNYTFQPFLLVPLQMKINLTETLAKTRLLVHENFGRDDVAKSCEELSQLKISIFRRKMVDEQVATFWSFGLFRQRGLQLRTEKGCNKLRLTSFLLVRTDDCGNEASDFSSQIRRQHM